MSSAVAATTTRQVQVTDQQVRHFVEQGYLVVPGLVSDEDLDRLKRDMIHLARGGYPSELLKPVAPELSDVAVLREFLCIHQPHYLSPVIREFVQHRAICAVLARIVAAHLPFWDGSVKCMQSMLFVKPPGLQGSPWHQDEIYIPTRDRSLCAAWIAIDDATLANGCLHVIPGSHRPGYLYPQRQHDQPEEFDSDIVAHGFDERAEIPVEVKAGTVVFFNGHLLHRSRRNRSQVHRRALVSHYMNAYSLLPWYNKKSMPDSSIARSDDRGVILVAGQDPYAWKGYHPEGDLHQVYLRSFAK